MTGTKVRIAHLAGPTATIQNTPPLVTSNKARAKYGLPLLAEPDGSGPRFDALRAQRLAAPATVYVEQFSAHPLERDAAGLYGPPDGYVNAAGVFSPERSDPDARPVYAVELRPEDGLYPLPYMARQADGSAWEEECAAPGAGQERARQGFFPDGSRSFEEIDRLSIGAHGIGNLIASQADVDFHRVLPPGGYRQGLPERERSDVGQGDIAPEQLGRDFFAYKPFHLAESQPRPALARITNAVQAVMDSGDYDGAILTQGSPQVEESAYWFNLLIDTTLPICGNSAQRPQGEISNDGPKNIVDSVTYIASRVWADEEGRNRAGVVVIQEQQIFAAREVMKVDARPGGYVATGGHGGIVGGLGYQGLPVLTYVPAYRHTYRSEVRLTALPDAVAVVRSGPDGLQTVEVPIKSPDGKLLEGAIPSVSIIKDGSYTAENYLGEPDDELDLVALIDQKLGLGRPTGLVVEGLTPYGSMTSAVRQAVTLRAVMSGLPVARVGRGNTEGFADRHPYFIGASNLTATKARLLLMASLLKFGSLPPARDPRHPTEAEMAATRAAVARFQAIFDTH